MVKERIKNLAPGAFFNAGPADMVVLEHFADGRTLLAAKEPIGNRPFTVRPFTYNRTDPEPNPNNLSLIQSPSPRDAHESRMPSSA